MIVLKKQEIKKEFLEKNGDAVIIGNKHALIGKKNIYDTTKNNVLVIAPEKTGKDYGVTYPTIVEGWKGNKIILDMQKRVSGSIGKFLKEESSVWTFYLGDESTLKYNRNLKTQSKLFKIIFIIHIVLKDIRLSQHFRISLICKSLSILKCVT